jgi:hypothetical protein
MSNIPPPPPAVMPPSDAPELELRWLDIQGQIWLKRMETINLLALSGLRTLTVINGGAIIALFTLVAQGSNSPFVKSVDQNLLVASFLAFVIGVAASAGATLCGFVAQQVLHGYEQRHVSADYYAMRGISCVRPDEQNLTRGNFWIVIGGIVAAISLIAFIVGSGMALWAALGAVPSS